MKVESITSWDEQFFEVFINFKNKIHSEIITSFPERLSDYEKFFGVNSVFTEDYKWEAFIIKEDTEVLAKAILCWRKDSNKGNLGYIDWLNNAAAAHLLIDSVMSSAKENLLTYVKTPVDLNFFVKYRIRLPSSVKPFFGEPIYPDYYHELFNKTGFTVIGNWDTFEISKAQAIVDFFTKRKKLALNPNGAHHRTKNRDKRTTIRCVKMKDWDEELRIIHTLFNEAYKSMPEWESISFDQFKIIYDDFKYIINPLYSYIIELSGKPVGFSINFADPLYILNKYKNRDLSRLQKLKILMELRSNRSCLLIAHVGKILGPNGEEVKGVQIQASKRIQFITAFMKKVLVTFQMKDSPSKRSFEQTSKKPYAQYVLYGREVL